MRLDDRTVRAFHEDGVAVLRGALAEDELERAYEAWQWSVQHPGPLASGLLPGSTEAFQDLCNPNALPVYTPLARDTTLPDVARQLWGGSPVWFLYEQVFHKRTNGIARTPWHQDTSYWSVRGNQLIAFWISFEPIPQPAALEFVRGSHRGTLHNTSRFDSNDPTLPIFACTPEQPGYLPPLPHIEANRGAFDIVSFATTPGDVIVFHTSTLHGGGATDATTPQRRTLTLRYFGADAVMAHSPGPPAPFGRDIAAIAPGAPFRHDRFLPVRQAG